MAEPIKIQVVLEPKDITAAGQQIARQLQSALDRSFSGAQDVGRKAGDALAAGFRTAQAKMAQEAQKINGRMETIANQSAARLAQIEAKKQADIDTIRERFAQRELERQRKLERQAQQNQGSLAFFRRYSSLLREAGESIQQAGEATTRLLTRPIIDLGRAAVQSAVQIDRQVNVLKSLTGSAAAAEERFKGLVAISAKSPGLTTSLAATLDAQLRVANVTVSTIDKILPAIGKLNAVSPLGDPQKFAGNLTQLITQGFERTDLKELVGQSPLAGELIKQIFGVDNPTNAKAIRESAQKAGIDTTEEFFAAFAQAAANNSKLAGVTESLGTQFEKLRDRVLVALRPLGLAIVEALTPIIEKAVPIIERLGKAFSELPDSTKQIILVMAALVAAIGPAVVALGALTQAFGALGNIITVISGALGVGTAGGAAGIGAALSALAPVILPIVAAVGALGVAWATNFGGIRDLTSDVVTEVSAQFTELRRFWAEIAPDLLAIIKPILEAIRTAFDLWSGYIGAIYRNAWEVVKTITREAADFIGPAIRALLALLRGDFDTFTAQFIRAWREAWEAFVLIPNRALLAVYDLIAGGIQRLLNIGGLAKTVGEALGTKIVTGIQDAIVGLFPSTVALIRGVVSTAESLRDNFTKRDQIRNGTRSAIEGRGLDGEEITSGQLAANNVASLDRIRDAKLKTSGKLGGGAGGGGAESAARQLREAQLRFTKETLEQQQRLIEDANQRELKSVQELYEAEKLTIREFYDAKLGLEQSSIGNSINILQSEIAATEASLRAAKANTPEKIRLESDLLRLRTDLELKTRALTDAETENARLFLRDAGKKRDELLKQTQALALPFKEGETESALNSVPRVPPVVEQANERLRRSAEAVRDFRIADIQLQREELAIQQAITQGTISEAQGKEATLAIQRQYAQLLIEQLEIQKQSLSIDAKNQERLQQLNLQIEQLRGLGQELSPAQAFFKGLRSEAETTAEAFERIGSNFKDKFLGVLDGGIDKLTSKFGFFKDLLGDILKSLTRKVVSQLLGLGSNGGGGGAFSGGGGNASGGGFSLGNLFGKLLNIGGASQGSAQQANLASVASVFTPGFAGSGGASSVLGGGGSGGGLASLFQSLINPGNSVSAPSSLSFPGILGLPGIGPGGTAGINPIIGQGGFGAGGAGLGQAAGGLAGIFKGIGFGKAGGSGGALAGLLPLLGVGLGSSLGTDKLTSILGGVAGGALGIGLTAAPAIIGAGGALSGLGFLAPIFSNPITAIAGALALPAIFLLGRARQRKRDEASSGDFLTDAINGIRDIRKQVSSDQLDGAQARRVFEDDVLQEFIAQINTLKTKSVRESRLKNQVADLKALFEKEVVPEIEAQKLRAKTALRLVPEFANSGVVPGIYRGFDDTLVMAHAGEMFLNRRHQAAIAQIAGADVFQRIGVPDAPAISNGVQSFASGGIVQSSSSGQGGGQVVLEFESVVIEMGTSDITRMFAVGAVSEEGRIALNRADKISILNRQKRG